MSYSILIPVDHSPWTDSAVATALWIASTRPGPVRLAALHVVNVTKIRGRILEDLSGMLGFEPVVVPGQVEAYYKNRGHLLLTEVTARCLARGHEIQAILDQGGIMDRIAHHGDQHDLVVMGLRGETEDQFPGHGGHTVASVLRNIRNSTLLVPSEMKQITGIALGYDGSDGAALALRAVAHLVEITGLPVHAFFVGEPEQGQASLDEVRARLEPLGACVSVAYLDGEPQEALPAAALHAGCNVLAVGFRGRSRLKHMFLGRTTEWLVRQVAIGILVAR